MDAKTQKITALQNLLGGENIAVALATGETESVMVRRLPILLYPSLADCLDNEFKQIELYCDKPPGWAETLAPESHNAVIELAERLNRPSFDPWIARRTRVAQLMAPMLKLIPPEQAKALASMKSSPSSASPAG